MARELGRNQAHIEDQLLRNKIKDDYEEAQRQDLEAQARKAEEEKLQEQREVEIAEEEEK